MRTLILLTVLWVGAFGWANEPARSITISDEAEVTGAQFTLGEIAQITAPAAELPKLKAVTLGASPMPGLRRMFTRGQVETRLRGFGFNPAQFKLVIPTQFVVSRVAQAVSAALIESTARKRLEGKHGERAKSWKLYREPHPAPIEPGDFQCEADPEIKRSGNVHSVTVRVHQNGKQVASYRLQFTEPLNAAPVPEAAPKPATPEVTLKAGDKVTVLMQAGAAQVQIEGTARTGGRTGDEITVVIDATKRVVRGRLQSDGAVLVQ